MAQKSRRENPFRHYFMTHIRGASLKRHDFMFANATIARSRACINLWDTT